MIVFTCGRFKLHTAEDDHISVLINHTLRRDPIRNVVLELGATRMHHKSTTETFNNHGHKAKVLM